MSRYGLVGQQYFDANGDPLSGGALHFYETSTETDKDTYSDEDEQTPNTNPVVLSADGRQGDIFFSGQAKIVLKDAAGTVIDTIDPTGESSSDVPMTDWNTSATYSINDLVKGSDDLYYKSVINSNQGNDPTTPSPTAWMQVDFVAAYNENYAYAIGAVVVSDGVQYIGKTAVNTGNTPLTSPTHWEPVGYGLLTDTTVKVGAFGIEAGVRYMVNTTGGVRIGTLPVGVVGDRVGFVDYAGAFTATNYLRLSRPGGTVKIMNLEEDMAVDVQYASIEMEYTADRGWILA